MAEPPLKQRIKWILDASLPRTGVSLRKKWSVIACVIAAACLTSIVRPLAVSSSLAQEKTLSPTAASSPSENKTSRDEGDDEQSTGGLATMLIRGVVVDGDEKPVVGANISTKPMVDKPIFRATSKESGAFLLRIPADGYYAESIMVEDADGKRASFISLIDYTTQSKDVFRIVLRPWRETIVRVVNTANKPIAKAQVFLIASGQELSGAATDADGETALRFPADAKVDWIVALKDGEGLDYYENYDAFPTQGRLRVPNEIGLCLDGAQSVSVTAIDTNRAPIAGVIVMPWIIHRDEKLADINMSGFFKWRTDHDGRVDFKWLPKNLKRSVPFPMHHPKYHSSGHLYFSPEQAEHTQLTGMFAKVGTIRGRVLAADGSPMAGIRIQGEGHGATNNYFRGHTSTRADGSYQLDVYPNQSIIVAVTDENFAAPSVLNIELREGEVKEGIDFRLNQGTLLTGTITMGPEKLHMRKATATLLQKGEGQAVLVRWSQTDEQGRYRFRVGPGNYDLGLGETKRIALTIENEPEMIRDNHLPRPPRGTLSGIIVDQNVTPIAGAEVLGESVDGLGHAGFRTKSGADGKYTTERWNDTLSVYAFHPQLGLAGYKLVTADEQTANFVLSPAATVAGKVVDSNGKPRAKQSVQLQLHPPAAGASANRRTVTDEQGEFEFSAVPIETHTIYVVSGGPTSASAHTTVKVTEAKRMELAPKVVGNP